jgi:hypothetical protein
VGRGVRINSPEHWRERAEEVRALAETVDDAAVKSKLLEVAAEYDRLAERAAKRMSRGRAA